MPVHSALVSREYLSSIMNSEERFIRTVYGGHREIPPNILRCTNAMNTILNITL